MSKIALIILGLVCTLPSLAASQIKVFACEPEWASLAQLIGGEYVDAYAATHADQDPHHIRARPSLIAKMRGSDLVICSGADLEVGWLPILLQKSGKASVQPGREFYLMAADFVPVLEKPTRVDRSMGDVHPGGNPHVHLNPHNIVLVAKQLNQRLQKLDQANAAAIQHNYENFIKQWQESITRWEADAQSLKGKAVITHHKSWSYLIGWLGLELVDTLEAKPGIPPSSSHLRALLKKVKNSQVSAIIRTPYDPDDASDWLANKTSIPPLVLPYTVGGGEGADDLFALYEQTLKDLHEAIDDEYETIDE